MNRATIVARELEAGRDAGVKNPGQVAHTAVEDAIQLATEIRDLDPRQLWGRLRLWQAEDPDRLLGAAFALAAMVPVDTHTVDELLKWTYAMVDKPRLAKKKGRDGGAKAAQQRNDAAGKRPRRRRRDAGIRRKPRSQEVIPPPPVEAAG